MYADSAYSQVYYYITPVPSLNVSCPQDPCLTLSQFAADSTSNETNLVLSFLPGNHSLDRELSLSHADNISMTKDIRSNGTVFVECCSQSGRFNISEIVVVIVKGLHFIGCSGNKVSQVEQFIVEDTTFQGVEGRGTALVLNQVIAASIARSSFFYNTYGLSPNSSNQEERNSLLKCDGTLCIVSSNVSIVSSKFTHNAAKKGGALFARNSSLYVFGSTYSYNIASDGGVMVTSESSVNIDNSTFSQNVAEVIGGVMLTYKDSFISINDSTFTNNTAGTYSGVMETYKSTFNITDSIFSDNTAENDSGVIYAAHGNFSIRNSSFTSNSAPLGGIMVTFKSSLNFINSIFTNNSATIKGGVFFVLPGIIEY